MTLENENEEASRSETPASKRGIGKWVVIPGVALAAIAGVGTSMAVSQDFPGRDELRMAWGGGHHMGHGPHRFGGGPGFGRVLAALDLTDEQEDRIWDIVDDLRSETRPLVRDLRDTREDLVRLLGATSIDRAAVEQLRAQRVGQVDEASKKLTAALIAAAEVLTPEQRAKLAEEIEEHHRGRW